MTDREDDFLKVRESIINGYIKLPDWVEGVDEKREWGDDEDKRVEPIEGTIYFYS